MSQARPRPLRVLVVEDRDDTRDAFRVLIGLWGHVCEAAATGAAALRLARAFRPDVVVMDIGLPDMDGYETACAMRKLPGLAGAVFVTLTANGCDDDRERSHAEGFAAHLVKPTNPAELRKLLDRLASERTPAPGPRLSPELRG